MSVVLAASMVLPGGWMRRRIAGPIRRVPRAVIRPTNAHPHHNAPGPTVANTPVALAGAASRATAHTQANAPW